MFSPDVVSLRQFYTTPLGEVVRALIGDSISTLWPPADGDIMLAIGYGTPYLDFYLPSRAPVIACMPAAQGAVYWPPSQASRVFLAHESELPLAENSINRVLLMHSAEHSEQLSWMMREVWRVLVPGGRVLAIVPNRLSFWSRSARSPFGYGRPFSSAQLRDLLTGHQFTLLRSTPALFIPPLYWRWLWRIADKIETVGKFICRPLGGVLILEAEKQLYAAIKQPVAARQGYRVAVPASKPAMSLKRNPR